MTTRYMVTYDIPSGRPKTGCVIHNDKAQYRIVVGDPVEDESRTATAARSVQLLQEDNPDASLEDVLAAYLGKHGYVDLSEWGDSPYGYEETIERLAVELRSLLHRSALERNARLMNIARAAAETGVDLDPDNQSMTILLDASGERERMSTPGLGYPVPDEERKRQIIAELLALADESGDEEPVIVAPAIEDVLRERQELPTSDEGS